MAPGLLQRCFWKALGKEAGGDWTGMTSNQLSSQLGFTFRVLVVGFLGGYKEEGRWGVCWNLSQGAWDLVLHWEPVVPRDLPAQLETQEHLEAMPRIPVLCHGLPSHDGSSIAGSGFYFYCYLQTGAASVKEGRCSGTQKLLQQPSNPLSSPAVLCCPRNPVENHPRTSCAPSTSLPSIRCCFISPKHDVLHPSCIFYFL